MSLMRKAASLALIIAVICVMMPMTAQVFGASKKTVYVVTKMKVKDNDTGKTTTTKINYTKNGFLKKIYNPREKQTLKFTYGDKSQLLQMVDTRKAGKFKGKAVTTYGLGDDHTIIQTMKDSKGNVTKYTFTVKNGLVVSYVEDNYDGKNHDVINHKVNKDGNVLTDEAVSEDSTIVSTYTLDKKGNIKKQVITIDGKVFDKGYFNAKIKYASKNKLKQMKAKFRNGMMDKEANVTIKYTYEKIKVKKSYLDGVKAQQYQLVNKVGPNFAW